MADLDIALAHGSANVQEVNSRGAGVDAGHGSEEVQKNQFFSKFKKGSFVVNNDPNNLAIQEQRIGGAFYLPVTKDINETWEKVLEALDSLKDCDVNVQETDQFNAYGLQYYLDTFMLARTRLCKVEGEEGNFLEIHRLQGDGFVFSDHFKKNLTEKIGDVVKDIESVKPVPSENAKDPILNFLDLSDDSIANDMIQHWLQSLKPKGGVKYDQNQIFETISKLGWNCNNEANFKVLAEYNDHIVGPVLEILRHPDMDYVPTAYFGSMCMNAFVQGNKVPEEVKTWASVYMLVEAMEKFCLTETPANAKGIADMQVTRSREVLRLLVSILTNFVPTVSGEQPNKMGEKVGTVLKSLENILEAETLDSLRKSLTVEEEVEAA